ncbi:Uu.00g071630.m01.CDS01 [Anthostomella pinea]|uniref:Uu.00g071630.m01.CDS01 n=1 Tax=Anthostomella pinea TaxID=933095 RepID=A0AAI8YNR5_9PEZI|nr:Uu.00g071630.m01.CDS01 [Anthostomella pinea]
MLSLLPDLTPRDSHSLWYTSPRNPLSSNNTIDTRPNAHDHHHSNNPHGAHHHQHRRGAHLVERSLLARLRTDEQNLDRRRHNVTNFGSTWLKPLGVPKTLHQLREERREAEEHQEAMRREQLAQELAEAEAAGAGGVDAMLDVPGGADDGMDDVQLDGTRDLDEDIPEAESADFGIDSDDDEDDEYVEGNEEEDAEQEAEERAARTQQQLMAQRMRQADDAFRENLARGVDSTGFYGVDEEVDDEDQAQMLEEEDLVGHGDDGGDMGMDADLDDEIPEAESAGYEHTDTEAELTNSDEDEDRAEMSFAAQAPQAARFRGSMARSDATRNSLAISDILSRDGSSVPGSSPAVPRQPAGPARRGRG